MKNIYLLLFLSLSSFVVAQSPRILIVTAHPDDETMFPVTIFKITHELKGSADLALMTDGSGGYNGLVASSFYGMDMVDSTVGRKHLPLIRKKEIMASGEIMGIGNFFFLDQTDDYYNRDEKPYLEGKNWDIKFVEKRLDQILARGNYDFIICLIPSEGQHAHHKTASISAIRAVQRYKGQNKPVILGGQSRNKDSTIKFTGLPGYPETNVSESVPALDFDRSYSFGEDKKHSYMIVADWVKAAHKSQSGDMNQAMHRGELETFLYFSVNGEAGIGKAKALFETINNSGFSKK
ncbi:PIG-L family deacetylase [Dyadobacter arcticus]|uniref:LmbE family N-acetylglucosaminyl deacetylase n=1 Tax=Dyadobacter arcticus TaxID=1078754 RepID=A0ABX0UEX1_9BACT|nr:PIG-L family deacetylase [Dyadobacter arcticus]NIJ51217.1 LmbE family N-acetylglucosaminyl deacetylase [Dyadobacter arcticus]